MGSIEQSMPLDPTAKMAERRKEVAAFLAQGIANGSPEPAFIRRRFDQERYVEELVKSAAVFSPEEITHDPAELVPDASAGIEEAATLARLMEHRRQQDEAA